MPQWRFANRCGGLAVCVGVLWLAGPARGQELRVGVPETESVVGRGDSAAQLDPVLRARVEELPFASLAASPAFDLSGLLLAVDCAERNPACLRAVAERLGVMALVAASLQVEGDEQVLSVTYYDVRGEGEQREVARRFPSAAPASELGAAIDPLLRELFGLVDEQAKPDPKPGLQPSASSHTAEPDRLLQEPVSHGFPWGPTLVLGAGVITLVAAIVVGASARADDDTHAGLPTDTVDDIGVAEALYERAERKALAANVLFGVGGAATAAGATWLVIELVGRGSESPSVSIAPRLDLAQLGIQLTGHVP